MFNLQNVFVQITTHVIVFVKNIKKYLLKCQNVFNQYKMQSGFILAVYKGRNPPLLVHNHLTANSTTTTANLLSSSSSAFTFHKGLGLPQVLKKGLKKNYRTQKSTQKRRCTQKSTQKSTHKINKKK